MRKNTSCLIFLKNEILDKYIDSVFHILISKSNLIYNKPETYTGILRKFVNLTRVTQPFKYKDERINIILRESELEYDCL